MDYAIILVRGDESFLLGFTSTPIDYTKTISGEPVHKYTIPLKEMSNLMIRLEGDAKVYLS